MAVFRSFLFAPGNHPRRVEKALTLDADVVILDLEDACPVSEKIATRAVVVEALSKPRAGLGYVRVNPITTEFGYGDLISVVRAGVDGIVVPKIEAADELRTVEWLVSQIEREQGLPTGGIDIMPIIETAKGVSEVGSIARSGTRVRRLAFGAGDYTLDMNLAWERDELEFMPVRSAIAVASRAANLEAPIDTVWVDMQDKEGFALSAARVRRLGFQGKLCIHPDQVTAANAAFTPTDAQVVRARAVVAAFEKAEAEGSASILLDGQFIDYPFVYQAQRVLASMERITARRAGPS
ncbi:CoA ester lyase [Enterovirga sp.]|uniref:HpcH/HpaI aldolase/citrate lyase family protein n=1 Tax=Enterovirga sp. TaxID=2026350 RepID=UPI00260F1A39|nr:CoA ester lyase [Enterovirga sp.]MDB5589571.1 citrate lyase subunit beta [Enterovirga sp.]